jgi:hypothetical protein
VVVIVGDGDPAEFARLIAKYYGDWRADGPNPPQPDFGKPDPKAPIAREIVEVNQPVSLTLSMLRPWQKRVDTVENTRRLYLEFLSLALVNRRLENRARSGGSYLVATVEPPTPGLTVYFKVFDVDDPFDQINASMPDVGVIDGDAFGPDNRGTEALSLPWMLSATTDAAGQARVTFTVSMQPGNNYRAGASLLQDAMTQATQSKADALNANGGAWSGYAAPLTWSPMLTVWRKLHVETDTMVRPTFPQNTFTMAGATGPPTPVTLPGRNPYEVELQRFVDCLRGRADPQLLDAERAIEAMNSHFEQANLVRREAAKKSRHIPLRDLLAQAPDVLTRVAPCWVASPLSVSQLLDGGQQHFDVVVFDEASQIHAMPTAGGESRAVTTLPAPTMLFLPILAPLSTTAWMPISEPSPMVQPCSMT